MRHLIRRIIFLGDWLPWGLARRLRRACPYPVGPRVPVPLRVGDWLGRLRPCLSRSVIGLALLLPLWPSGAADAQTFPGALRGDYDVTLTRVCAGAVPSGSTTGPGFPFTIRGVATFNGDGTGSFTGEFSSPGAGGTAGIGVDAGGGTEIYITQANQSCTITYTVNADGSFTETLNCNNTFTLGGPPPAPGQTNTITNIPLRGKIAHDGTVLLLQSPSASTSTIETVTTTSGTFSGTSFKRICESTGLATSRR